MKRIKLFFKSMNIQSKVLSTYILLIIAPLLCFFIVANITITRYSQKEVRYSANQAMELTSMYINQNLYSISRLINSVMLDDDLYNIITNDYNNVDSYTQYKIYNELELYITGLKENYNVSDIVFYTTGDFEYQAKEAHMRKLDTAKNERWYKELLNGKNATAYYTEKVIINNVEENYITISRLFTDRNNFNNIVGAVCVYVDENIFGKIVSNSVITLDGMCYIINSQGDIITTSKNMNPEYFIPALDLKNHYLTNTWGQITVNGKKLEFAVKSLEYGDWKIVSIIPRTSITSDSMSLLRSMLIYLALILIAAYILAYFISKSIVSRIVKLNNHMLLNDGSSMERVLSADFANESHDEIDILIKTYNKMLKKIEEYTILQYENGKKIKSAELKLLQEQINPHFLYNVLDLVNWMAIKSKNKDIEKVVYYMAQFYKIGLNSGNETIKISQETEHVKYYVQIQKMRFKNVTGLTIDVPSEIMNCVMIKTIFQPLVENSINHGIRDEDIEGEIKISAEYDDKTITFLVSDNGKGIEAEIIEKIKNGSYKSTSGSGFGLKNLNERIKIFYGDEYGITFGDCKNGADIYVKIPRINGDE
ncbi:MAG: hypothetical protein E7404_08375 [Ruminococcaceae bacterium]|nr:hypothetical protein [Oscillospiraceae bacterium]